MSPLPPRLGTQDDVGTRMDRSPNTDAAARRRMDFPGRVILVGCGSIGQAALPLIARHISLEGEGRLVVLSADEQGRGLAGSCGAHFEHAHLTPGNHRRILGRHVRAGDLVLNLSVNVSSLDLIRHPRRGLVEPDQLDHEECLAVAEPYLGKLTGQFTDWTPLQGRGELFPEHLDADSPWQLQNIRGRQWIA